MAYPFPIRMIETPIRDCEQAADFLISLIRDDPRPYIERASLPRLPVQPLLERLGNPQDRLPAVHIAGSKGKGSTALLLESILERAGLRTGTFTSPHLQRWTERFRIDGSEMESSRFVAMLERLRPHVLELHQDCTDTAPGFFDVLTAAGLVEFADASVDCAIIETGIGGRLDATNVVTPRVSCITSVELEHTDKLGTTLAQVAREKAGIVKPGVPVVTGALPAEAERVIRERAAVQDAPLHAVDRDFAFSSEEIDDHRVAIRVDCHGQTFSATLPPNTAPCTVGNAALAIACAHQLDMVPPHRLASAVDEALSGTRLPARLEIVSEQPWIVIDGAHTEASVGALADLLDSLPAREIHLVVSMTAAKDAARVLAPLLQRARTIVVTAAEPQRSANEIGLARTLIDTGLDPKRLQSSADPREAIRMARDSLQADHLLCVTGSMYMAGLAREILLSHQSPESI